MFFGNQVTCEYWDYVWLNEGFASYLEHVIADKVRKPKSLNLKLIASQSNQQIDKTPKTD
jgi:aminopeptidase N